MSKKGYKKRKAIEKSKEIERKIQENLKEDSEYQLLKTNKEFTDHLSQGREIDEELTEMIKRNDSDMKLRELNARVTIVFEDAFKRLDNNAPDIDFSDIDKENKKINKEIDAILRDLKKDMKIKTKKPLKNKTEKDKANKPEEKKKKKKPENGLFIYKQQDEEEIKRIDKELKNNKSLQEVDEVFASMKRRVEK